MVKFQPSFLIDKYNNSIDTWLLPIPVIDDGKMKLRCFMSKKKKGQVEKGVFRNVYTYDVSNCKEILYNFFSEKSYGQAYRMFIRLEIPRTNFFDKNDHEKDVYYTIHDVNDTILIGRTAYVCSILNKAFQENNIDINWKGIKEKDRKTDTQLQIKKQKIQNKL